MANVGDLKVQLNLTISELRQLVALATAGNEYLVSQGAEALEVADDVGGLYFELMSQLQGEGAFETE